MEYGFFNLLFLLLQTKAAFHGALQEQWDRGVSTQPTMGVYKVDELFEAEIVITTKFYPVSSPLEGMKTLQKIYLALNCKYPPKSKQIWTFVQVFVFEIPDNVPKPSSTLIALNDRLKK
jgi:hypothetical protein